jgi:hypothetical protein
LFSSQFVELAASSQYFYVVRGGFATVEFFIGKTHPAVRAFGLEVETVIGSRTKIWTKKLA